MHCVYLCNRGVWRRGSFCAKTGHNGIQKERDMKKNRKPTIVRLASETPEARKERVSSGAKFRVAVFASKKRKLTEKYLREQEQDR
jgi:hypothetical protein